MLLLVAAVTITLLLAYWQWTRYRSGSGTFQNLGYAMQWPAIGAFFVFVYKRYLDYEKEIAETGVSPVERELAEGEATEIDPDFLPSRPEVDVDTFNRMNTPRRRGGEQ